MKDDESFKVDENILAIVGKCKIGQAEISTWIADLSAELSRDASHCRFGYLAYLLSEISREAQLIARRDTQD